MLGNPEVALPDYPVHLSTVEFRNKEAKGGLEVREQAGREALGK